MRKTMFLVLAAMMAGPAHADTRAVYDERGERRTITFEIDESGDFRAGREDQYRLVLGDDAYQVAQVDGRVYVAHLADLAAALRDTSSPLLRAAAKTATFLGGNNYQEWTRIGRKTVNGRRGVQYRLQDADHGFDPAHEYPFEHDDDTVVVVSEDPALEPLGDAMLRYTAEELYLKRHFVSGVSYQGVLRDLDDLARLGTVIASSEGDIRLASVEDTEIVSERLILPAEPMAREEIVRLIRAKRNPFKL